MTKAAIIACLKYMMGYVVVVCAYKMSVGIARSGTWV